MQGSVGSKGTDIMDSWSAGFDSNNRPQDLSPKAVPGGPRILGLIYI